MTLTFYNYKGENNRVTKDIGQAVLTLTDVKFKDNVDEFNPVLELKYAVDLEAVNYFYIDELGKYYFKIPNETTGIGFIVRGHEDVLMTYDRGIRQQTCVIARNSSKFNSYIPDDRMHKSSFVHVMTIPLLVNGSIGGFTQGTQDDPDELLLAVNGRLAT